VLGGNDRQVRALALSPFISQKFGTFVNSENHKDMVSLAQLIDAGKVTPVIERTYPLHDAPKAIRHLEEGHARGKLVISISIAAAADGR
jgi:NADPH:quinone reductase-like Zn-dependent oxidoreductase